MTEVISRLKLRHPDVYGHTTLNTPVLVRSPKLSNVGPGQYLDGRPPGNTGCCRLFAVLRSQLIFVTPYFSSIYHTPTLDFTFCKHVLNDFYPLPSPPPAKTAFNSSLRAKNSVESISAARANILVEHGQLLNGRPSPTPDQNQVRFTFNNFIQSIFNDF